MSQEVLTELVKALDVEPQALEIEATIIDINTDARPIALQIALLVPIGAALIGLVDALRMRRLPDIQPSAALEGMLLE